MAINFISIDVGGTFSRLRLQYFQKDKIETENFHKAINSKEELFHFIKTSIHNSSIRLDSTVCCAGFAGVIINENRVKMTNWHNSPTIKLRELHDLGLPQKYTKMVNDMELAAFGCLDLKDDDFYPIYQSSQTINKFENKLVIAPGTGFGTAFIVSKKSEQPIVISSEIQHSQIPFIDEMHEKIYKIISIKYPEKCFLNFEDFVSGKGLEDIYLAILEIKKQPKIKKKAAEIAQDAIQQTDKHAAQSLDYFYGCIATLMQAMALFCNPLGGIFLCGGSTIKNQKFIKESIFLMTYFNCEIRDELLKQFPIYLVTKSDINIAGGLRICQTINQDS